MSFLDDIAAAKLRERGINPDLIAEAPPPPTFNAEGWRLQQAEAALAAVTPDIFKGADIYDHRVAQWVMKFNEDRTTVGSLTIAGERGSGKTHHAFAALRRVVLHGARFATPVTFRVTTHPELNDVLRDPDGGHRVRLDAYESVDLLILDDLAAGRQTEWTSDALFRLVNARWSKKRPTIYTTNLSPDDVADAVGDRIASRIVHGTAIRLDGPDRRGFVRRSEREVVE